MLFFAEGGGGAESLRVDGVGWLGMVLEMIHEIIWDSSGTIEVGIVDDGVGAVAVGVVGTFGHGCF